MKPFLLYESGIKPWEQPKSITDSRFVSVSLIYPSVDDLSGVLHFIIEFIHHILHGALIWRTIGHSCSESKTNELMLVKRLKLELDKQDFLKKNCDSGIVSFVKLIKVPFVNFNINTISQSKYTALIFLLKHYISACDIWTAFKGADAGLGADGIYTVLNDYNEMIISRVYESDTYACLQLIGEKVWVDAVFEKLQCLDIDRVEEWEVAARLAN